jgi:hypothetical protein
MFKAIHSLQIQSQIYSPSSELSFLTPRSLPGLVRPTSREEPARENAVFPAFPPSATTVSITIPNPIMGAAKTRKSAEWINTRE